MAVRNVMLFPNGASAVCDEDGNQIPALQESWFLLFLEHLVAHGVNPAQEGIVYELPGNLGAKVFVTETGYNWYIEHAGGKTWHMK